MRFIVDQGCGCLFTFFGISLLVVVLWCVGNPDLWDRGLVCFWGTFLLWLVYPNLPIAWAQARSHRSVVDEEAILGGLRSGEDLPDYDFEELVRIAGVMIPIGTPRSRGRFTDDGDDRIFRQATDDEQAQRARPDRGGESGFRQGHLDVSSMAMNMARPHSDDPEAMPTRPPRSLNFCLVRI